MVVNVVRSVLIVTILTVSFFFQAEDGIRDLVRSRGLGDVYKRQGQKHDGRGGRLGGRDRPAGCPQPA